MFPSSSSCSFRNPAAALTCFRSWVQLVTVCVGVLGGCAALGRAGTAGLGQGTVHSLCRGVIPCVTCHAVMLLQLTPPSALSLGSALATVLHHTLASEVSLPRTGTSGIFFHTSSLSWGPSSTRVVWKRGTEGFDGTAFLGDEKETIFSVFRKRVVGDLWELCFAAWISEILTGWSPQVISALSVCDVRCSHVPACYLCSSLLSLALLSTCKARKEIFPVSACAFFQQWWHHDGVTSFLNITCCISFHSQAFCVPITADR